MSNKPIIIANGIIVPMTEEKEFNGSILVSGSKIARIAEHSIQSPDLDEIWLKDLLGVSQDNDVMVINASGKWILPGFIDAHCHVGIGEEIYRYEGDDLNEMTDPLTPELRAIDGLTLKMRIQRCSLGRRYCSLYTVLAVLMLLAVPVLSLKRLAGLSKR